MACGGATGGGEAGARRGNPPDGVKERAEGNTLGSGVRVRFGCAPWSRASAVQGLERLRAGVGRRDTRGGGEESSQGEGLILLELLEVKRGGEGGADPPHPSSVSRVGELINLLWL